MWRGLVIAIGINFFLLIFSRILVNYSHDRYATQTTKSPELTIQPSIASDTLANHALWSFDDAQSSV